MMCTAAVIHGVGQDWSVEVIEVDTPEVGEVLVHWTHAGLRHSDEHLVTGDDGADGHRHDLPDRRWRHRARPVRGCR